MDRSSTRVLAGILPGAAAAALAAVLAVLPGQAPAQTVRIGVVNTFTGPNSNMTDYIDRGMRLYMKTHESGLPPGVKVELVTRDDGGPNPDAAKRLAQELIVREKVQFLAGFVFSPNAAAVAPLSAEAKVPMVIMNAATSSITTLSPYAVRVSFTLWQTTYPLGQWAGRRFKRAYTLVADYSPGFDAEAAFEKGFRDGGGEVVGKVRTPMSTQDYAPFMERVKESKPDVLFAFVPAGRTAIALLKSFRETGLDKAGIRFIGTGDTTPEDELAGMGDAALGVYTSMHYAASADRPANRSFVAAWKKEYGEASEPVFTAVAGWDGMDAIYGAIRAQKGNLSPEQSLALLRNYRSADSPRGPISIDPETRDIVQNIYLREVRRVGPRLENVEIETIGTAVKDPWKEFNRK